MTENGVWLPGRGAGEEVGDRTEPRWAVGGRLSVIPWCETPLCLLRLMI